MSDKTSSECGERPWFEPRETCTRTVGHPNHHEGQSGLMWGTLPEPTPAGVWVVWLYNPYPHALSIHPTEVEALREAVKMRNSVSFVEWGQEISEACE